MEKNAELRRFIIERDEIRKEILDEVASRLRASGLEVEVDGTDGVLRLSDSQLFETGEFELSAAGLLNVGKLRAALEKVLPCFAKSSQPVRTSQCEANPKFQLNAFLVEGHADMQRVIPNRKYSSNEELSTKRALTAYNQLNQSPILAQLYNRKDQYLISVSGYGAKRALCSDFTTSCHSKNRRIELRLLMDTPDADSFN